jgi:hypothetical protein
MPMQTWPTHLWEIPPVPGVLREDGEEHTVNLYLCERDRNCIDCGAPFKTFSPKRKRCDPCQKIAVKKQQQKAVKRLREKRRKAREASRAKMP